MRTCLLMVLALSASAASVTAKFDYNFTGVTRCSPTVTTSCLEKFEVGTLNGTTFTSMSSVPLPGGSGAVTGITAPAFAINAYGSQVISAIAVAKDAQGNRITSDPAAATANVNITPGSPTNITVTVSVTVQ